MKVFTILCALLFTFAANAENCDNISGTFQTTTEECKYSRDGVNFYNEGHKKIRLTYTEVTNKFDVEMQSAGYSLHYIADGAEQVGRPYFEGNTYVAQCMDNKAKVRGVFELLRFPLIKSFELNNEDKLTYKETFEGDSSIRICEMDRVE